MIYAVVGKPGTGKTYNLVRFAEKFLRQGINVYSNIIIDETKFQLGKKPGTLYYWYDMKEFADVYNGVVLWDEIGAYFDSRNYEKFPEEIRRKFQQYRKERLDIYYSVQAYGRTDLIIRQITNIVIECNHIWKFFWTKSFDDPEAYLKDEQQGAMVFPHWFNQRIASAYDTYQSVKRLTKKEYQFRLMKDVLLKGGDTQ